MSKQYFWANFYTIFLRFIEILVRFFYLSLLEMAAKIVLKDVQEASKRIAPYIHRTPIMTCSTLDKMAGKSLFFKCEIFQKVGAFKVRIIMILEVDNIYLQCYILACIEERTVGDTNIVIPTCGTSVCQEHLRV